MLASKWIVGYNFIRPALNSLINILFHIHLFVTPSLSLSGVRLPLSHAGTGSHFLCVARNAQVLSGYVECVTRRYFRIGENWRGLLCKDGLSEKQQD
ncbi:MAG: hypothetical protein JO066_06340 [Verrucomicrobia bacterium]|nr:hypothetical protein [Verrucomicrobiota bacterium]